VEAGGVIGDRRALFCASVMPNIVPSNGEHAMRTAIAIDDELLAKAQKLSGIKETAALVRHALTLFVQRASARRLALLGGTEPDIQPARRRRSERL
jgi:Arc/MetJ family transcription regulator